METKASDFNSHKGLLARVLFRFFLAFFALFLILFIPAGSFGYWNAWLYLITIFVSMVIALSYLFYKDPELLEKRINIKEKEKEQKTYVKLSSLLFLIFFIIPGLDYRFSWSSVPFWLVVTSLIVSEFAYLLFIIVMRQNSYASRVIEIQDRQKLIDSGLYSVIRHPMYFAATIMYLFTPLALGSYYALIPILFLPFLLGYRIINEEKVLIAGLEGYTEYMKRVKYRLIPFIW